MGATGHRGDGEAVSDTQRKRIIMTEKEIKEAESVKHRLQKYRDLEEGAAQIQAIITHMAAWDVPEETGEWKGKP